MLFNTLSLFGQAVAEIDELTTLAVDYKKQNHSCQKWTKNIRKLFIFKRFFNLKRKKGYLETGSARFALVRGDSWELFRVLIERKEFFANIFYDFENISGHFNI